MQPGEVGVAVVVPRASGVTTDPDSILAHFKAPKRCVVVAGLPPNAMEKVQKNVLRMRYAGSCDALSRSKC